MLIRIELKPQTLLWSASSNIPHILVHWWSWSLKQEKWRSVGMFPFVKTKAPRIKERSSQDSSECVRKEDWHICISHRLIAVFTMTENEKNKFSHLLPAFLEASIPVLCFVTIRYLSVWCVLYLGMFGYKGRQTQFFSSPAGNGIEEKNEPPTIKTVRDRKDTLIAESSCMWSEKKRLQYVWLRGSVEYQYSNTPHAHGYFRKTLKFSLETLYYRLKTV
jgi:hypothetical protein